MESNQKKQFVEHLLKHHAALMLIALVEKIPSKSKGDYPSVTYGDLERFFPAPMGCLKEEYRRKAVADQREIMQEALKKMGELIGQHSPKPPNIQDLVVEKGSISDQEQLWDMVIEYGVLEWRLLAMKVAADALNAWHMAAVSNVIPSGCK